MSDLSQLTVAGLLGTLRRSHEFNSDEDFCPASVGRRLPDGRPACDCGAQEHNERVDKVERELNRRAEAAVKAVQRALGRCR